MPPVISLLLWIYILSRVVFQLLQSKMKSLSWISVLLASGLVAGSPIEKRTVEERGEKLAVFMEDHQLTYFEKRLRSRRRSCRFLTSMRNGPDLPTAIVMLVQGQRSHVRIMSVLTLKPMGLPSLAHCSKLNFFLVHFYPRLTREAAIIQPQTLKALLPSTP